MYDSRTRNYAYKPLLSLLASTGINRRNIDKQYTYRMTVDKQGCIFINPLLLGSQSTGIYSHRLNLKL